MFLVQLNYKSLAAVARDLILSFKFIPRIYLTTRLFLNELKAITLCAFINL